MKKNKHPTKGIKPLVLLALALLMGQMNYAQSIDFDYTDGTNTSYNIDDVRKITFDADVMNLHFLDGSVYSWNVSTVGNFQYDETSLIVEELINTVNAWEITVFPNPTSNYLQVRFNLPTEDEITISLYDVQGKILLVKHFGKHVSGMHQRTLDLTNVTEGTYVCRIVSQNNSITKKIIKQ